MGWLSVSSPERVLEIVKYSISKRDGTKCNLPCCDDGDIDKDELYGYLDYDMGRIISGLNKTFRGQDAIKQVDEIIRKVDGDDKLKDDDKRTCKYWLCSWKQHLKAEIEKEKKIISEFEPEGSGVGGDGGGNDGGNVGGNDDCKDDGNGENCKENEKISPKDMYNYLLTRQEAELNSFWQRAGFLSTILLLIFPGYGLALFKILDCPPGNPHNSFLVLNVVALAVAYLGFILSIMYVMVAKGSKFWYEAYEMAMSWIVRDPRYSDWEVLTNMKESDYIPFTVAMPKHKNCCLFSLKAWRYSPTKTNVAIGRVSMVLWFFVFLIHLIVFLCSNDFLGFFCNMCCCCKVLIVLFGVLVIVFLVIGAVYGIDSSDKEEKKEMVMQICGGLFSKKSA